MSETVLNDIENKQSFQVNNPAMAAAFTPFLAITPIFMIALFRDMSETSKIVLIICYFILLVILIAFIVTIVTKVVSFVLDKDRIIIGKREYGNTSMDQVRYNKKTKYVQLHLKSGSNPSMHLKDQLDEERFIDELKQWTDKQGIRFTIIDKRAK